ncbi:RING finger protein 145-like [Hemicordylus capensis]|uniref:RING finger protein 145-like n=1 Tax=Hemicordylus capensis TaxID=884348 RepID=UPI0023032164|nr:RING finger protein 145-like [Hemicordylus capensis]
MPRLEKVANVILRVPNIVLLDLLYRWDVQAFAELLRPRAEDSYLRRHHLWHVYYAGHLACVVVLLLPVRFLVKLYLYLLTALLLYVGHQTARDYIRAEMEREFHGAVYNDPVALSHFATALTGQVLVIILCALLLNTKRVWLLSAPLLPLVARLCCLPLQALPVVSTFAATLTALEVLYVLASSVAVPFRLAAAACREMTQMLEVYRLVALGMSLWRRLAIPLLFLVFWLALFTLQIWAAISSSHLLSQQGLLFVFLSSVAECCSTPYSLIGLTFTVSYLALGLLKLCKFYLAGYGAFQNGNVMHRGVTEGVTLLLLALQTGLLDLQLLQRTFLLSIILFIVVTSTLQSMIEIANPIVLGLGASRNRSLWKHFRGVSMCLFLLVFPGFMAYKIAHFFHMDFWLLILVSSCMLTSLQVMGTLFIYALFMVELFQDTPMEKMDEVIYCINAISCVLEFLVAVCVVAYGTWESIFGEWSWMGASVIIIHCYFNVWLRAQSGWKSFLLRREAAKKINSLPRATRGQLQDHNDICAICFQEMALAVITRCGHFFHEGCLRKWFYVQDTCPLCHQPVKLPASEEAPANPGRAPGLGEPAAEGEEAPGPEDGGSAAHSSAESSGSGRTAEAGQPHRTEPQGPLLSGPAGEELPAGGSGEPVKQVPSHGSPQKDAGASSAAASGGQVAGELQHPPAPGSPTELFPGALGSSPGEPSAPGQGPPQTTGGSSHTQGSSVGPCLPAAGGHPAGEHLEGPTPRPGAVGPLVAAEGRAEEVLGGTQQPGTVTGGLKPSGSEGHAEDRDASPASSPS